MSRTPTAAQGRRRLSLSRGWSPGHRVGVVAATVATCGGLLLATASGSADAGVGVSPHPRAALAPATTGPGCWLAAAGGGVFAFGGAPFRGSMAGHPLNAPVMGIAAYP